MRHLRVTVLGLLLVFLPILGLADNKPGQPIVQPDGGDDGGCVECSRYGQTIECGGAPTGAGWSDCEGGWILLCDPYAGCVREPNCGDRCAIA